MTGDGSSVINQSKQIYIASCVASESEAGTRWSKQCQTVPSLTYGQKYREQFAGSTVVMSAVLSFVCGQ